MPGWAKEHMLFTPEGVLATWQIAPSHPDLAKPGDELTAFHQMDRLYGILDVPFAIDRIWIPETAADIAARIAGRAHVDEDGLPHDESLREQVLASIDVAASLTTRPGNALLLVTVQIDPRGTTAPPTSSEYDAAAIRSKRYGDILALVFGGATPIAPQERAWLATFAASSYAAPPLPQPAPAEPARIEYGRRVVATTKNRLPFRRKNPLFETRMLADDLQLGEIPVRKAHHAIVEIETTPAQLSYRSGNLADMLDRQGPSHLRIIGSPISPRKARATLDREQTKANTIDEKTADDPTSYPDLDSAIAAQKVLDDHLAQEGASVVNAAILVHLTHREEADLDAHISRIQTAVGTRWPLRVAADIADAAITSGAELTVAPIARSPIMKWHTPQGLASVGAHHGKQLGHPTGRLIGILAGEDWEPPVPVYFEVTRGSRLEDGGTVAVTMRYGPPGFGKTYGMKEDALRANALSDPHSPGRRIGLFVVDVHEKKEWERVVPYFQGETRVVSITRTQTSLDPIALTLNNAPETQIADAIVTAKTTALHYLAIRLGLRDETSEKYTILDAALAALLREPGPQTRLAHLPRILDAFAGTDSRRDVTPLTTEAERSRAASLSLAIRNLAKDPTNAAVWADAPPLDFHAPDTILWQTPGNKAANPQEESEAYLIIRSLIAFTAYRPGHTHVCVSELHAFQHAPWLRQALTDLMRIFRHFTGSMDCDTQRADDADRSFTTTRTASGVREVEDITPTLAALHLPDNELNRRLISEIRRPFRVYDFPDAVGLVECFASNIAGFADAIRTDPRVAPDEEAERVAEDGTPDVLVETSL